MKLDKHTLIWTGGIAGATALALLAVTRPQMQRISQTVADVNQQQTEELASAELVHLIAELEAEVAKLSETSANFDERVPQGEQLGAFLEELARAASSHDLQAGDIQPGKPVRSKDVVALPITFRVQGPFREVFDFVKAIEGMERLTLVERFTTELDKNSGDVSAELRVKVYYRAT